MANKENYESLPPRLKTTRKRKRKRSVLRYLMISLAMTIIYFFLLFIGINQFEPLNLQASGQTLLVANHGSKELSLVEKAPFPEPVYEIYINKSNNQLTVYIDGKVEKTFPVATGSHPSLTPVGTFQMVNKIPDPWYIPQSIPGGAPNNPLGHFWLGLNVPGTDGSIYGIHGTNNPSSIGKYVSAGCIRMYNEDVRWLYENVPLHSNVVIHY